jgi:hypothetical protein
VRVVRIRDGVVGAEEELPDAGFDAVAADYYTVLGACPKMSE